MTHRITAVLGLALLSNALQCLGLEIINQWSVDLSPYGSGFTSFYILSAGADGATFFQVGGQYFWISANGTILRAWTSNEIGNAPHPKYLSSSTLVLDYNLYEKNVAPNLFIDIYTLTNNLTAKQSTNIIGISENTPLVWGQHSPPAYPSAVLNGNILSLYVARGPEIMPLFNISKPTISNGVAQLVIQNGTDYQAEFQTSPNMRGWSVVEVINPLSVATVTAPLTNRPNLFFRAFVP